MPIYHFANIKLGPGSIVEPGNFGRLLKRYVPGTPGFGNAWLLARELVFEQLRPEDKPSRLNACFACPTMDDVEKYRKFNDQNFQQVLHEVEPADPTAPRHVAGLSFLEMRDGAPFLDPMRLAATNYWSGQTGNHEKGNELVTPSALRVLRSID